MTRLIILPVIFSVATFGLWLLLYSAPGLHGVQDGAAAWSLPKQFDNFTAIAEQFKVYQEHHFEYITTVFIAAYLYKQTFAIPGSFFLVSFFLQYSCE
jgi:hypothetical protein